MSVFDVDIRKVAEYVEVSRQTGRSEGITCREKPTESRNVSGPGGPEGHQGIIRGATPTWSSATS